ncbi:hypothetical protein AGOR_G00212040 [Albula goreensis]|uniref:Ig-like domain-containing protein n=1 Tax=Albula goreensis TaxID=1534307 RepID=A0A8T3CUS2_9TELE|nr:hypothetical protein AGOR_G00212040 [Albula goreensis]
MEAGGQFIITLTLLTGLCSGQNALPPGPVNGSVGGSVMFNTDIGSEGPFIAISWSVNNGSGPVPVASVAPGGTNEGPGYEGRVSVNTITGSLELKQLTLGDTGTYTVNLIQNTGGQLTGDTTLNVYERISGAEITGPSETLIAGISSANLSCQAAAGTSISREWLKGDQPLSPSNRITFSEDKSTVFISPVESSDNGEYQCRLSNPVSTDTASYTLTVNYGPEDVLIKGVTEVEVGKMVELICSAKSEPPANFSWTTNGTDTSVTTAKYIIYNATYDDSGNYTCVAENAVTGLSRSSAVQVLTVGREGGPVSVSGPPLGAILGGVFGSLGCVGLAVAVAVMVMKTKRRPSPPSRDTQTAVYENAGPMGPSAEYGNLSGTVAGQPSSGDADRPYEELQFKHSETYCNFIKK